MNTRVLAALALAGLLGGCAGGVTFHSVTPGAPEEITATLSAPPGPGPFPVPARWDDARGALGWLQSQPFVRPDRVAALGFSQGGVYAIAVINGPSLERAQRRGVTLPEPGFAAAVGVYPGGCFSLVKQVVGGPLLVLIGEADDWTPAAICKEMTDSMRARGAAGSIVIYP